MSNMMVDGIETQVGMMCQPVGASGVALPNSFRLKLVPLPGIGERRQAGSAAEAVGAPQLGANHRIFLPSISSNIGPLFSDWIEVGKLWRRKPIPTLVLQC